jgi:hypothetical protein
MVIYIYAKVHTIEHEAELARKGASIIGDEINRGGFAVRKLMHSI